MELEAADLGVSVATTGFDGRSDVVAFGTGRGGRAAVLGLRTIEDVFVEVGRASRTDGDDARAIARRVWRPAEVERALSVWAAEIRPLSAAMTFRVVARVLHERSFLRTELRREVAGVVGADRPSWRSADPAELEVWVSEYRSGEFVAGLHLSDARTRQHDGRQVERPGALRPTVAAAMVMLAGEPSGTLLDPCCGAGSIVAEAIARGWTASGLHIDPDAVDVAQANVSGAAFSVGDVRNLDVPDGSLAACVSNLPFGRQYRFQGPRVEWMRSVLGQLARVTRAGGRVVLLAPQLPLPAQGMRLTGRYPIALLGTNTTIWALDRM